MGGKCCAALLKLSIEIDYGAREFDWGHTRLFDEHQPSYSGGGGGRYGMKCRKSEIFPLFKDRFMCSVSQRVFALTSDVWLPTVSTINLLVVRCC